MTISRERSGTAGTLDAPPGMRAAVIDGFGTPDVTRFTDVAKPVPVGSEVLVRIVAAGLNPIDGKTRSGTIGTAGIGQWPAVLGVDFSGVVITSPYESFPLQPGDEVYGTTAAPRVGGSFAEYAAVPSSYLVAKPQTLSYAEAAAVPTAALTAWGAVVEQVKAHEGQRILIQAGAGGVGHFAVQIAAYFGAHVIATCSGHNVGWVRELGAAEVVDYSSTRFEEVVDQVDAVIDLIGDNDDHVGPRSLAVLRRGGLLVNVPSGSWPTLIADAEAVGVRATTYRLSPDAATLAVISRLITSGDLRVHVDRVFPFESLAEAQRTVEAGHVRGKVVLQLADY